MAKQTVNLGTTANDGTGDPLRTAFDKLNDNFDEVYGNSFVDTANIADDAVTADKLADSINSEIAANTAKVTNATHTGDVTGSTALTISADVIDHDELAPRYTAVQTIGTTTATLNLDASSYSVFNITANLQSTQTLNIQNMKTGQVIDVLATGTSTVTLTADDTSETFNNLGEVVYDGSANNHIQIVCIDDTDSAAIYNYTIQTYTSDNTPN